MQENHKQCEHDGVDQGGFRAVRCSRRATVDGRWCWQHSPAYDKSRRERSEVRYKRGLKERLIRVSGPSFYAALKQIAGGANDARAVAREALRQVEEADKR